MRELLGSWVGWPAGHRTSAYLCQGLLKPAKDALEMRWAPQLPEATRVMVARILKRSDPLFYPRWRQPDTAVDLDALAP